VEERLDDDSPGWLLTAPRATRRVFDIVGTFRKTAKASASAHAAPRPGAVVKRCFAVRSAAAALARAIDSLRAAGFVVLLPLREKVAAKRSDEGSTDACG
jgi:hypothetical protein